MDYTGQDVIGQPGQNLSHLEISVLVGLADGNTPSEINAKNQIDRDQLRQVEGSLMAKLGARTKSHLISRGFILGVLVPRALCFSLILITTLSINSDVLRARQPMRTRTPITAGRLIRNTRSGGRA